jgi:hypothetical protein
MANDMPDACHRFEITFDQRGDRRSDQTVQAPEMAPGTVST